VGRTPQTLAAALGALLLVAGPPVAAPAAAGAVAHVTVVSEDPADWTPHVLDGSVDALAEVGDVIVAGGDFTSVAGPGGREAGDHRYIFAFERRTGRVLEHFAPDFDAPVRALTPGPDGTVIAGGAFREVDGEPRRGLVRLSLRDGGAVGAFRTVLDNGRVHTLESSGRHLYVGGSFSSLGGTKRTALARLDARTGRVDPDFDLRVAEARRGTLRVEDLAVASGGRRLLIAGPFTRVAGERRYQIALIDTAASPARLRPWSTEAFAAPCDYEALHTYVRAVDFAPDGSYFTVAAGGGPETKPGLCKTATRWEADAGADAEPTWVNHTGGDSLFSVAATGAAVYVAGHQQWMDNPEGDHSKGPGAVDRLGIAALDPRTGRALAWNPGRDRGHGAEALLATRDGLYVGDDTDLLGSEHRPRVGLFPLD
jgi:hypothetical protein